MKKNQLTKAVSAVTGAAMLLGGMNQNVLAEQVAPAATNPSGTKVSLRQERSYDKIANVQGEFAYEQDMICPSDEVFNIFGTVTTAACGRPRYAFDEVNREDYYINFGGSVTKFQSLTLEELKAQGGEIRTLKCSCASSPAIANAQVVGVPMKNILQLVDLQEETNTVTFTAGDGYKVSMPLSYALEKDVLFVYQVGESEEPSGVQVWVPQSVARYFARNVVDVDFSVEEKEPDIIEPSNSQRAKVSIVNSFDDTVFSVGDQIELDGYADDFDTAIVAVEFSLDDGATWTTCETKNTTAEKWVYWHFAYVTEKPGTFKLDVRARTANGTVSPLASSTVFTVME